MDDNLPSKKGCLCRRAPFHFPSMSQLRSNYIYVDYENIHDVPLDGLAGKPVFVVLVIGERQKSLPLGLVKQIHQHRDQVELLETGCSGKNALDLVIAFHIGRKAASDPLGFFHIVSRDKMFDALVKHLGVQSILAARRDSMAAIPALQDLTKVSDVKLVAQFKERLTQMKAAGKDSRPKKEKALRSTLEAHFRKELTPEQVETVLKGLRKGNWLQISPQGMVSYSE